MQVFKKYWKKQAENQERVPLLYEGLQKTIPAMQSVFIIVRQSRGQHYSVIN